MSETHREKTDKRLDKLESEVEAIRQTQKAIMQLLSDTNKRLDDLIKKL